MLKINFGSHNKRIKDFVNVDALDLENVDVVHDLSIFPYPFANDVADEILAQEFLEHLPQKISVKFLKECYRILKPCGLLTIQVPDIGAMCMMYAKSQLCDCVPRKAKNYGEYKANPACRKCGGKALIHPDRWRVAFSGAQKHEYDSHLNHYTFEILREDLRAAGFTNEIVLRPNIYKLIILTEKPRVI